jgi:hypothetical protein
MAEIYIPKSHTQCHADGCEWDIDWICAKCGGDFCEDHLHECVYCKGLKVVASHYCDTCAQGHELTRTMRGGCVGEFESEYNDKLAEAQRREESYKKRGLI